MRSGKGAGATLHPVVLSVPHSHAGLRGRAGVEALSAIARQAVLQSASVSGLALDGFPKDGAGVPLPSRGVYWSLSHKPGKVAGVVASFPVGIDLEKIRPVHTGLYRRLAADREWELAGGRHLSTLFKIWTAKEAALKASGLGLAGLSQCRIREVTPDAGFILEDGSGRWNVILDTIGADFVVALAARGEINVIWHLEG